MSAQTCIRTLGNALVVAVFVVGLGLPLALRVPLPWFLGEGEHVVLRPTNHLRGMLDVGPDGTLLPRPHWNGAHEVAGVRVAVRTNALGLRGAEVGVRQPDERRVLVVGDSIPWGYGVADDATFAAVLEERLRADGVVASVGNAGVPGAGTVAQIGLVAELAPRFGADVVVACIHVGNDFEDDVDQDALRFAGNVFRGPMARWVAGSWRARLSVVFQLPFLLEQLVDRFVPAWSVDRTALATRTPAEREAERFLPPPPQRRSGLFLDRRDETDALDGLLLRFGDTLDRLRAAAGPARVLVVVVPSFWQVLPSDWQREMAALGFDPAEFERGLAGRRLARVARDRGLPVVDLTPRFQAGPAQRGRWILANRHLSERGHRDVAAWIEPDVRALLQR